MFDVGPDRRTSFGEHGLHGGLQAGDEPSILGRLEPDLVLAARDLRREAICQTGPQRVLGPAAVVQNRWLERQTQLDQRVVEHRVAALDRKRHEVAVVPLEQPRQRQLANLVDAARLGIEPEHVRGAVVPIHAAAYCEHSIGIHARKISTRHAGELAQQLAIAPGRGRTEQVERQREHAPARRLGLHMREVTLPIAGQDLVAALAIERHRHTRVAGESRHGIRRVLRQRSDRLVVAEDKSIEVVEHVGRGWRHVMRRRSDRPIGRVDIAALVHRVSGEHHAERVQCLIRVAERVDRHRDCGAVETAGQRAPHRHVAAQMDARRVFEVRSKRMRRFAWVADRRRDALGEPVRSR